MLICVVDDAENGGFEEGVRGHNLEHGKGSSGSNNGLGAQSSSLSAGSVCVQRRSASDAPSLEADDRFQGFL